MTGLGGPVNILHRVVRVSFTEEGSLYLGVEGGHGGGQLKQSVYSRYREQRVQRSKPGTHLIYSQNQRDQNQVRKGDNSEKSDQRIKWNDKPFVNMRVFIRKLLLL